VEKKKTIQFTKAILILAIIIFFVQLSSADMANSTDYSVGKFTAGSIGGLMTGGSISEARFLTTASQPSTSNANFDSDTVNVGFFENTSYTQTVSIQSYSVSPTAAIVNSPITLSISALNAQSVWAMIVLPDSSVQTINLANNGGITFTSSIIGIYNVTFYANSSTGAIATAISHFELIASPPPVVIPSGGGGGGTTTVIQKCDYIWNCTSWSICNNGIQTRQCNNVGTCTGEDPNKPPLEAKCIGLFDVSLKNVSMDGNRHLIFDVNLQEQIIDEKIDVNLKYSIISDNEEIFSQLETKAVQGNLSYTKKLDEIRLLDGKYILRVDMAYDNLKKAFAEEDFTIKNGQIISIQEVSPKSAISQFIFNNLVLLIIISSAVIIIILFLLMRKYRKERMSEENKKRARNYSGYVNRIKDNLRRIQAKHFLILLFSIIAIAGLLVSNRIIGLVIGNAGGIISNNSEIIWIVLIAAALLLAIYLFRRQIKQILREIRDKFAKKSPKNSISGLLNKKVYTSDGNYLGEIKEVILEKDRIEGLKIELGIKNERGLKGIIVKYKNVQSVGHVVIIENILNDSENYKNKESIQ